MRGLLIGAGVLAIAIALALRGRASDELAGRLAAGLPSLDAAPDPVSPDPGPTPPIDYAAAPGSFSDGLAVLGSEIMTSIRKVFTIPPAGQPYAEAIRAAEQKNGLPDSLLARVLYQESRFRPDIITGKVRSRTGATGIAQFMPKTAAALGVDPLNPTSAINGAARELRSLFDRFGDWTHAIAAYNWGQGNLAKYGLDRAPAETKAYVSEIGSDVTLT